MDQYRLQQAKYELDRAMNDLRFISGNIDRAVGSQWGDQSFDLGQLREVLNTIVNGITSVGSAVEQLLDAVE